MVKIKDCLKMGTDILKSSSDMPKFEAEVLLAHILGKDRLYLTAFGDREISSDVEKDFYEKCQRRALGEPSAYILGEKEFMSLSFEVNPSVLIPRPDTELVIEMVVQKYEGKEADILDLCTGSGAIACSLAYYLPHCTVTGTDISEAAIATARRNAKRNFVDKRVDFVISDVLQKTDFGKKFDIVISNPPYIETSVIATLEKDVKDFEPSLALDGGDDGLIFYRKIVDNIDIPLKKGGELYFEIGYNQAESVTEIMRDKFCDIQTFKDLAGHDRVVKGQLR